MTSMNGQTNMIRMIPAFILIKYLCGLWDLQRVCLVLADEPAFYDAYINTRELLAFGEHIQRLIGRRLAPFGISPFLVIPATLSRQQIRVN